MDWKIYPKHPKGHTYYYAQRNYREKAPPSKDGKPAKSKVRSETIYLGTAESIIERIKGTGKPIEARHRDFGFVAAIYQTAVDTRFGRFTANPYTGRAVRPAAMALLHPTHHQPPACRHKQGADGKMGQGHHSA
jgi:hypothetical protein